MRYTTRGMRRRSGDKWEVTLSHKDPFTGQIVPSYHTVVAKSEKTGQEEARRAYSHTGSQRIGSCFQYHYRRAFGRVHRSQGKLRLHRRVDCVLLSKRRPGDQQVYRRATRKRCRHSRHRQMAGIHVRQRFGCALSGQAVSSSQPGNEIRYRPRSYSEEPLRLLQTTQAPTQKGERPVSGGTTRACSNLHTLSWEAPSIGR